MLAGQAIRLCRKTRCMTQGELAKASGFSVAHISLVERGKRDIMLSSFLNVSKSLQIPPFLAIFSVEKCEMTAELQEKLSFMWLQYARGGNV
jgi:transcriptional regulator with XRE-family HTH domain